MCTSEYESKLKITVSSAVPITYLLISYIRHHFSLAVIEHLVEPKQRTNFMWNYLARQDAEDTFWTILKTWDRLYYLTKDLEYLVPKVNSKLTKNYDNNELINIREELVPLFRNFKDENKRHTDSLTSYYDSLNEIINKLIKIRGLLELIREPGFIPSPELQMPSKEPYGKKDTLPHSVDDAFPGECIYPN